MRDVSGFRLQEEQEVSVSLRFIVIGKGSLLQFGRIFEMARDFVLLGRLSTCDALEMSLKTYLFQSHAILDQQSNARVQIPDIFLENKVFL